MLSLVIDWLVQGTAVALVAALAARMVPAGSPAQRHLFWWCTLAAVLALPVLRVFPFWSLASAAPSALAVPAARDARGLLTVPAPPAWVLSATLGAWLAFALMQLARLSLDLLAVRRCVAAASAPSPEQAARLTWLEGTPGSMSRGHRVLISSELRGACAAGFLRPAVLLSASLAATLDDEALMAVVQHERAHLERFDNWTRLLQRVVLALAGLHPAVRWVSGRIDLEREMACDRHVVNQTGEPLSYARSLTRAAEVVSLSTGRTPLVAPGASGTVAGLHGRVLRLLAVQPPTPRRAWAAAAAGLATLGAAAGTAVALPPIVSPALLTRQLQTLASLPLPTAAINPLPTVASARLEADAAKPQAVATGMPLDTNVRTAAAVAAPEVPVSFAMNASLGSDSMLESLPLSALTPRFLPPIGVASRASEATSPWRELGDNAARAGSVSGMAASRAGGALGRFFRNGGTAVASRF